MTPTENQLDSSPIGTPFSREDVTATMEEWARTNPPSRFMVYGITDYDPDNGGCDGDVIAWGLGFDDHLYVQAVDSHIGGRFSSSTSLRRILFHRNRDINVVWVDPEPENLTNG